MNITITGKDFNITNDVREFVNSKFHKLDFADGRITNVHVIITVTPTNDILSEIEVHHTANTEPLFVSHEHKDWRISITDAVNKIRDLIVKEEDKLKSKRLREARKKRS